MASSKNITILLFLSMINVVFFGFTMAQAPICPRSSTQLQVCGDGLTFTVGGLRILTPRRCCSLVIGLDNSVASVCICNALKLSALNRLEISARVDQVLESCGVTPPAGFICA